MANASPGSSPCSREVEFYFLSFSGGQLPPKAPAGSVLLAWHFVS